MRLHLIVRKLPYVRHPVPDDFENGVCAPFHWPKLLETVQFSSAGARDLAFSGFPSRFIRGPTYIAAQVFKHSFLLSFAYFHAFGMVTGRLCHKGWLEDLTVYRLDWV